MKKITCWIVSIITILAIALPGIPVYAEQDEVERYTVLVLDVSDKTPFKLNGRVFYVADSAVDYVKTAAKGFVNNISYASGRNHIAIVIYYGSKSEVISPFSDEYTTLYSKVDGIKEMGKDNDRNISAGLSAANDLIDSVVNTKAIKNVVLFTTGITNIGEYNYKGHYNTNTVGSIWEEENTRIRLYAYSNYAYEICERLKTKATVYVIGLYQIFERMPSKGQDIVSFFKLFSKELASSPDLFFEVDDPEKLEFTFGEVAEITSDQEDNSNLIAPHKSSAYSFEKLLKEYPSSQFNPQLAYLLADICNLASNEEELQQGFKDMGFGDSWETDYNYRHKLFISFGMGTKKLEDGTDLVLVSIRGSSAVDDNPMEWVGNLFDFWPNEHGEHSSFSDAGRELWDVVKQFLEDKKRNSGGFDFAKAKYVITGHSRGAAAANILAAGLDDLNLVSSDNVYCYTFACPDTVHITYNDALRYDNIFNIGNISDPVTWAPGLEIDGYSITDLTVDRDSRKTWKKYGVSLWFPVTEWDDYDNISDELFGDNSIISRAKTYHPMEEYLKHLRVEAELDRYKNRDEAMQHIVIAKEKREEKGFSFSKKASVTVVNVLCPVDVSIYDADGNSLISIVDNKVESQNFENGCFAIINGDKKYIYIDGTRNLDIRMSGTGDGEMSFSIKKGTTPSAGVLSEKAFNGVSISKGKNMKAQYSPDEDVENTSLFVADNSGNITNEIMPDGHEGKVGPDDVVGEATISSTEDSGSNAMMPDGQERTGSEIDVSQIAGIVIVVIGLVVVCVMGYKLYRLGKSNSHLKK